jgi:hypothetical protein
MIDPATSMNVMRALQAPNNQNQAQGGGQPGQAQQGGQMPQAVQQLIDVVKQAIGALMAAAKSGGQKEGEMSQDQKQQTRNAVDGVPNGRLAQERNQMTG